MEKILQMDMEVYALENQAESVLEVNEGSMYVFDAVEARVKYLRNLYTVFREGSSLFDGKMKVIAPRWYIVLITEILHFILKLLDILIEMNISCKKGRVLIGDSLYEKKDFPLVIKSLFDAIGNALVRQFNINKRRTHE